MSLSNSFSFTFFLKDCLMLLLWKNMMEKAGIDGRTITNMQFAGDIDVLAEEEQELEALV